MIDFFVKHRIVLFLCLIIIFAGLIRFYKLAEFPVSPYWDEVSIANNANFILETGRDEHGEKFPLIFKGFNDYKSPGNIYLTTIPVKIFGLNEFSARFVSAFLGTLMVIVMFFLGKYFSLFARKSFNSNYFGLIAAFLIAISPWHIQFSRAGFEANSGLFFVTLGIALFFIFMNNSKFIFFFFASAFFAVSTYFYRSDLLFAPLFISSLVLLNYKLFLSKEGILKLMLGILIFSALFIPIIPSMMSEGGMSRNNNVSIFNPQNSFEKIVDSSQKFEKSDHGLASKIIYNRRMVYADLFVENYKSYFTLDYLFFAGDSNERHKTLGVGHMYLWQLPFLIIGVVSLFFIRRRMTVVILFWLVLAAIPAALSVPASHALRSLNMLPAYILIATLGVLSFYKFIPKKYHLISSITIIVLTIYSFIVFVNDYKKTAYVNSFAWADGYKQLFTYLDNHKDDYEKIIISGHYWQPYAYSLFYSNYDPKEYLKNGNKDSFDKYIFGGTIWEKESEIGRDSLKGMVGSGKTLVVISPPEYKAVSKQIKRIENIYNHNNKLVFIIGEYVEQK